MQIAVEKVFPRLLSFTFALKKQLGLMCKMIRILAGLAVLAAASCSPLDFFGKRGEIIDVEGDLSHEMMVLGEQLENPYSVTNVEAALQSLYPTRGRIDVHPTDLYVRFLPESDEQYQTLESLGIVLMDHPLDYRIVRDGDYYHDPDLPDDAITWQYAVVPPDFSFPEGIRHEELDPCYISDNDPATRADGIDWSEVEREAYRITGNGDLIPMLRGDSYDATKPKGRIAIVDEDLDSEPIGVKGVRVVGNSFVKFCTAYTDDGGYYQMDRKFTSKVRYRLVFKNRKGFSIGMNLLLTPASTSALGKHSPDGVSITVDRNSERKLFCRCVVNNACRDYFEKCSEGTGSMRTPPSNLRIWLFQKMEASSTVMMQQGVGIDGNKIGEFLGVFAPLVKMFLPDITLGLEGKEDYSSIYASAIHECAHASHFAQVGREYWEKYILFVLTSFITSGGITYGVGTEKDHGYCEIGEMWAYYVQTKLFRERYPDDDRSFGTSFWFYPQIFLYLDERGIDRFRIFSSLGADVTDKDILKQKLLSLYPESRSVITQAFVRYM